MSLGQGEWEVFQVPHIVNSTKPLGARFAPILYRLEGEKIFSHVKYNLGPFGEGWLSASGLHLHSISSPPFLGTINQPDAFDQSLTLPCVCPTSVSWDCGTTHTILLERRSSKHTNPANTILRNKIRHP